MNKATQPTNAKEEKKEWKKITLIICLHKQKEIEAVESPQVGILDSVVQLRGGNFDLITFKRANFCNV